jgi:pentatricopeptide repeat protein
VSEGEEIQTPPAEESPVVELFGPTSPHYMPNDTPPTFTQDRLTISADLSAEIDRHVHRNPLVSPLEAYAIVKDGLTTLRAPDPAAIARLLDNIGRLGAEHEPKVHELYALGNHLIQTQIPLTHRVQPWWLMENAMLIATCHLGYLEQAGLHRARLVEAGYPPGPDAYATMIACAKDTTDDALVARELWDESRSLGVKPNIFLYNTIISKLSRARKAEMALELFRHMKEAKVKPSSVTYGAIIVSSRPRVGAKLMRCRMLVVVLVMRSLRKLCLMR